MDEIDAALDNVNVTRVADFIRERAEEGHNQFVVISLKDTFYEKAQALVGIYRDRQIECSPRAPLLQLRLEALGAISVRSLSSRLASPDGRWDEGAGLGLGVRKLRAYIAVPT